MNHAIGMIETIGFVGSIEAADAMLKAANITLVKLEKIDGGIVTVIIQGDIGAVLAAIETGEVAASKINKVLSAHVIARTDDGIKKTFLENQNETSNTP